MPGRIRSPKSGLCCLSARNGRMTMGKASRTKRKRPSRFVRTTPTGEVIGPVPPDVMGVLEDQRRKFIEKFGRDPGPGGPVFFDPRADTPQPLKIEEKDERKILA